MESWKLVATGGAIAVAGMAFGAWVFGVRPASAQASGFRECIIARQESLDTNGDGVIARPDPGHTVRIPSGWTPIGGGGLWPGNDTSTIVFCR